MFLSEERRGFEKSLSCENIYVYESILIIRKYQKSNISNFISKRVVIRPIVLLGIVFKETFAIQSKLKRSKCLNGLQPKIDMKGHPQK